MHSAETQVTHAAPALYDRRAAGYDAIVGRSIYLRIFWGTSAPALTRFARLALEAAGNDGFAEAGCGTLVFTSPIYREFRGTCAVLMDRSAQMLSRAMKRLTVERGRRPDRVAVVHADIASMPVQSGVFSSILSLNVLHVPCDVESIAAVFGRSLRPGRGRLFVSSLVRSGRCSDAYLAMLHRTGEFGKPMTADELCARVCGRWGVVESMSVEGNMCFLVVRHAG
jgi:SAM-dependent methyltransferase